MRELRIGEDSGRADDDGILWCWAAASTVSRLKCDRRKVKAARLVVLPPLSLLRCVTHTRCNVCNSSKAVLIFNANNFRYAPILSGESGSMSRRVANDDRVVSLVEAEALIGEIERLRAETDRLEARVGQLDELAHRDPLVHLPNRRSFLKSLELLIARVDRHRGPAAMLFVDVDGLKAINDTFGHQAGDEALIQVAKLLVASVRKSDCVARIGGDEFGILLEHADESKAWQMALRVVETVLGSQFCVNGSCLPLSVAVGVGKIEPGDTPHAVMERADRQMYRVKTA
jgi:diguanylate cyclase (GGDEF)-like protein